MSDKYVWFLWSAFFLLPWIFIYLVFAPLRKQMFWTSVFTAPFGLTEPLFVPEYWNPPTLFDLAQRTGFDVESLIFCFGIGGTAVVFYNIFSGQSSVDVSHHEKSLARHKYHKIVLFSPIAIFIILSLFKWNIIYPVIFALIGGAIATILCRPDLLKKSLLGGLIFVLYYLVFLLGLEFFFPGYIARYWNLDALWGLFILNIPIEELLFAFGFGMYWSSVYEHVNWKRLAIKPR